MYFLLHKIQNSLLKFVQFQISTISLNSLPWCVNQNWKTLELIITIIYAHLLFVMYTSYNLMTCCMRWLIWCMMIDLYERVLTFNTSKSLVFLTVFSLSLPKRQSHLNVAFSSLMWINKVKINHFNIMVIKSFNIRWYGWCGRDF